MSDFFSITLEDKERMRSKEEICNRSLIAAILHQAMLDACCAECPVSFRSARYFISPDNKMFKYYCALLDYDPVWISKKIWIYIKANESQKNRW